MQPNNKVLIVEDEEILAANIMTHVQLRGWEARIAPTGQRAVAALGDFVPQVILLDYHLPDMNAFQILEAMCARYAPCPCVLMTGHPTEHIMADAERLGIGRILCKPFALAEMEASLASAISDTHIPCATLPVAHERRKGERRTLVSRIFEALHLGDGTSLTCDLRSKNRRR